jgi:glycosyltransferase involved in cell wall biosynthesis
VPEPSTDPKIANPKIALSLIVPAYNEAARIPEPLGRMIAYLANRSYASEIIVVDDGSEDDTAGVARRLAANAPIPVEVVRYPTNGGKGLALKVGFARARGERILFTDADLSVPIELAEQLLAALDEGADLAIGTRNHADAKLAVRQPRYREVLGAVFTVLVRLVISPVSDATCGFKAFRGDVGRDIFAHLRIRDWSFDAEVLFLARRSGYRVRELPVAWSDRPGSNVRIARDAVQSLLGIARIRWNAARGLYERPHPVEIPLEVWREAPR